MNRHESLGAVHTHTHTSKLKEKIKITLIIVTILLIIILCFNVGVYAAYVLSATDVSYIKSGSTSSISVKTALDELYTKVPIHEIGDEVTVGGEQFYVLEWDNYCDSVTLISKYNLNQAGTAQQNAEHGDTACIFSNTNYWSKSLTDTQFNLNDLIGYEETDVMGKAKNYGRSKGAISSRLLSYEEAIALKSRAESDSKIRKLLGGTDNTADGFLIYWLGCAYNSYNVWVIYGQDLNMYSTYCFGNNGYGVRPVITMSKSKIS